MASVVFYFQVHQPYRVKPYNLFDIGHNSDYFLEHSQGEYNQEILAKVSQKCYLPTNTILLELLNQHPELQLTFSLTGTVIDQLKRYQPQVLDSFKALVATGQVELLAETYYHSLAALYSKEEFSEQVTAHMDVIGQEFGVTPTSFRNTELIYNNAIASLAESMGFKSILAEGSESVLGWRSPNFVYQPKLSKNIVLLLKNYKLSDDIAFRFSNKSWSEYPLTAQKYTQWLLENSQNSQVVNLFMDYETFGEHHWSDTGIHHFLMELPKEILKSQRLEFKTVTQASQTYTPQDDLDIPQITSWADSEKDISAWLENPLQQAAAESVYKLREAVLNKQNSELTELWKKLTTSDHLYYMSTKENADGQVHNYFSPHKDPYQAYNHYMTILQDLRQKVYT